MKSPIVPPYYQGICYIVELIISINYNEEMVSIPQLVRIKGVTRSTWAHRVCAEIERWVELSTMRALGGGEMNIPLRLFLSTQMDFSTSTCDLLLE